MNKYKTCNLSIILCLFLFFKSSLAENLEIEASGFLEWNQENNSYIADGNAIASQGTRSIKADKITAFYESEENRDIARIKAEGAFGTWRLHFAVEITSRRSPLVRSEGCGKGFSVVYDMGHQEVEVVELIEVTNRIYASILSRYLQL